MKSKNLTTVTFVNNFKSLELVLRVFSGHYCWDITSLVIDDVYDGLAIYLSHERLNQVKQNNAEFERARAVLARRIDRLHAEMACYKEANQAIASGEVK